MNKIYQYSLLKYCHSKVLEESINLGLLVYSKDDKRLDFIYPKHLVRLTTIYPNVSTSLIRKFLRSFEDKANAITKRWNQQDGLVFDEDLYKLITDLFLQIDSTSLQFSEVSKGLYSDYLQLKAYLNQQFFSYYEGLKNEKFDEAKISDFISTKISSAPIQVIPKFNREIELNNGITSEKFPYSWQNGRENILVPVSFDLEQSDSIKRKSYQWFGVLETFYDLSVDKNYNFDLFVTRPKVKKNFKVYDQALSVLETLNTPSRIVEQDGFNNYIDEAVQTLLSLNH